MKNASPHVALPASLIALSLACNDRTTIGPVITPPSDMTTSDMTSDMTQADMPDDMGDDMPDEASDLVEAPDQVVAPDMPLDPDMPPQDMGMFEAGSMAVEPRGAQVVASWSFPQGARGWPLKLLRRHNAPVEGPFDTEAEVIYEGAGAESAHPTQDLLPTSVQLSNVYHYALYHCPSANDCEEAAPHVELRLTVKQALQGGGYAIFWRHASASTCGDNTGLGNAMTTTRPDWWRSCESMCSVATARQLTHPAATNEMNAIREFMFSNAIAFTRVLSSEFCRCFQTAEGFDFGPQIELVPELTYFVHNESTRCADSLALINTPPPAGGNSALVGHAGFSGACPTLGSLQWSEGAIYKPRPGESPLLVQILTWNAWQNLP